jgi:hypothetical protein
LQENPPALNLDGPGLGRLGRWAAGHRAIAQAKLGLVEGALHMVAVDSAIAELGVAVGHFLPRVRHGDACAFKQISLTVTHYVALVDVLVHSDLMAIVPERFALRVTHPFANERKSQQAQPC